MHKLLVSLHSSSNGVDPDGNDFDVFLVTCDGQPIGKVSSQYRAADDSHTMTTDMIQAAPFVFDRFALAGSVVATVMKAFTSEHEFYSDLFVDADGNAVSLPLEILS